MGMEIQVVADMAATGNDVNIQQPPFKVMGTLYHFKACLSISIFTLLRKTVEC